MISPQAIIEPGAQVGENVSIGPFSIIGENVVIGDGCVIGSHVTINGHTRLGSNNHIDQFASIGGTPQSSSYAGEPTRLTIGDNNLIREYVTVNTGTVGGGGLTRIGSDNFLMAYAHVAHDCILEDHIIFANGTTLGGHVHVGHHAILGGFTLVHQFVKIGAHTMTGGGSICLKDIPPYLKAAGHPIKPHGLNVTGLKRRGFSSDDLAALKSVYRTLYREGHSFNHARQMIGKRSDENPHIKVFAEFLETVTRGVIR
jgi:UDP-N-acetylglucosamine acyltransferase